MIPNQTHVSRHFFCRMFFVACFLVVCTVPTQAFAVPDLAWSQLGTGSSSKVVAGSQILIYAGFRNASTTRATNISYAFYFSTTKTVSASSTLIERRTLGSLAGGASHFDNQPSTLIKANVPKTALGALYIVAVVDDLGTITESNETNNTTSYKINVVSPPDIDLVFNTLSTPMNVPGAGSTFSLKWTVQNTGVDAAGAFSVKISYGDSVQPTNLVVLAEVSLSGLSGGSTSAVQTTSITLPPSVRYGSRVLHLEVDAKQAVVETNEANNVETRALSIDGKPDLYVSRMGLSLTPLGPGQKAVVSYQIKNQGKSQANGSFEVKIYESATQTITSASTLLRTFSLTDLDANRSVPLTGTTTFAMNAPANAPSGRRWIVAVVDTKSTITESNESNNTRVLSYTYQSPNTEPVSEPRSESVIDAGSREFVQEKSFFESAKEPMKEPVKEAIVESVVEPSTELKSEPARDGSEPMVPDIHSVDVVIRDIVTGEKVNELDAGSTEVVVPNQGCGCSGGDSSSFPTLMLLVLLLIGFRKRRLLSN